MRARWRRPVGVAAIASILVIGVVDWRSAESEDSAGGYWDNPAAYFAFHTITASVLTTVLFAAAAWLFYDASRKDRERLINDSTTSIGFAGSVRPLIGASYVLGQLGRGNVSGLLQQRNAAKVDGTSGQGPHKWVRPQLLGEWPGHATDIGDAARDAAAEAEILDECIRQLVGTVRDWADLFITSELGRQGSYCIQATRKELQMLMQSCRADKPPDQSQYKGLGERVARLARAFEAASDPGTVRDEVRRAEAFYGLEPLKDDGALKDAGRDDLKTIFGKALDVSRGGT